MEYAFTRDSETLVHATDARRHVGYECPTCRARVNLRSGNERTYFAHFPGQGRPDCELYHPATGVGLPPPSRPKPQNARPEQSSARLAFVPNGRSWSIVVQLKEIAASELGRNSLLSLRGGILVESRGVRIAEVPAIDLRPGRGWHNVPVEPFTGSYECRSFGDWPHGVDAAKWEQPVPAISRAGCVFHAVGDECLRIPEGGYVYTGEIVYLVAPADAIPPRELVSVHLDVMPTTGVIWNAWCLRMPNQPNDARVRRWLEPLGLELVPEPWRLSVLTPPLALNEDGLSYGPNAPLVIEVTAPEGGGKAAIRIKSLRYTASTTITAEDSQPQLIAVTPTMNGTHSLSIGDAPESRVEFNVDDGFVNDTRSLRLRIRDDGRELPLWESTRIFFGRLHSVELEPDEAIPEMLELDVTFIVERSGRIDRSFVALREALDRLRRMDRAVSGCVIDAGSLGCIRLIIEQGEEHRQPPQVIALLAYYRARANAPTSAITNSSWRQLPQSLRRHRLMSGEDSVRARVHLRKRRES
jgi:hypothetical protein